MKARLKALLATPRGRIIAVAAVAALLGVVVIARRKKAAVDAGATPTTIGAVAANPNSSAMLSSGGDASWADYGTTAPYEGGWVGGGGVGGGAQASESWFADISARLEGLGDSIANAQATADYASSEAARIAAMPTPEVFSQPPAVTNPPAPAAPVATKPAPAAPSPGLRAVLAVGSLWLAKSGGGKVSKKVSELSDDQIRNALRNGMNNNALKPGWKISANGTVVRA